MNDANNESNGDRRPSLLRRIARRLLPPATPQPEERESIWSIARRDVRTFFRLLGLLWTGALAYIAARRTQQSPSEWTEWPLPPDAPWWQYAGDFVMAVMADFTLVGAGFAILAMLLTRPLNIAGDILMSLYQAMVNRLVTPVIQAHEARGREVGRAEGKVEGRVEGLVEGRVEGLAEGQAAERAQWVEWNRRRVKAAAKGQPFHEPPPGAE